MTDELLNTAEAAKLLKSHPTTMRQYARDKIIPAKLVGGRWKFSKAKIMALIEEKDKK